MSTTEPLDGSEETGRAGPAPAGRPRRVEGTGRFAAIVALGIFLSRVLGLVRESIFAHFFGTSDAGDAFKAAFKIPNLLQNLFGEGALSASFIPVYAGLVARGEREEAGRVAGAVIALLSLVTSGLVLVGVLATPLLIALIAPGFAGEKRELTIRLVQILFPGAGILVLSAWCLGILNSHRRFFLSYTAPVLWNVAMIATLVAAGPRLGLPRLALALAWGSVAGSALQLLVQLPGVLTLLGRLRARLDTASANVRVVVRNFVPVFFSRGVVQVSAYVDQVLASWLPSGAVVTLGYAQNLYTLPVSLFGMSVSAAELPAMSGEAAGTGAAEYLRARLDAGLRRIAFFVVPSAAALLAFGDIIAAAIYQSGRFTRADAVYVWGVLAGSTVGLLASTLGRLYASTYYALRDTRTPLRFALVRVALTTLLGYLFAFPLPRLIGIDPRWGVAGLTMSAGIAGWVEFALLRRGMNQRIGRTGLAIGYSARLWAAALAGAAGAWGAKLALGTDRRLLLAAVAVAAFGAIYLALTAAMGVPEVRTLLARAARRRPARGNGG